MLNQVRLTILSREKDRRTKVPTAFFCCKHPCSNNFLTKKS
nr:MAG TPA: hypothetical protein [Caudoviricetes sp.]